METNRLSWLGMAGLGVLALTASIVAAMLWLDARQLQNWMVDVRAERAAAVASAENSERLRQEAEQVLSEQRAAMEAMHREIAELSSKIEAAGSVGDGPRRAIRTQVYAGRKLLGDGWVIKGGGATNAHGGASEVVVLDENLLRPLLTATAKEAVAASTPREVTVNYNYANQQPYSTGFWPVYWRGHSSGHPTNRPPSAVQPLPPETNVPGGDSSGNGGIWRPTQKPFLPSPSPWPIATPNVNRGGGRINPVFSAPRVNPALSGSRVNPALSGR